MFPHFQQVIVLILRSVLNTAGISFVSSSSSAKHTASGLSKKILTDCTRIDIIKVAPYLQINSVEKFAQHRHHACSWVTFAFCFVFILIYLVFAGLKCALK